MKGPSFQDLFLDLCSCDNMSRNTGKSHLLQKVFPVKFYIDTLSNLSFNAPSLLFLLQHPDTLEIWMSAKEISAQEDQNQLKHNHAGI